MKKQIHDEYFAQPGLSNSGMKDLAISPLRYWYLHLNPERPPDEPTAEMHLGTALHTAVLEPNQFDLRYARALSAEDFSGCLVTMDDLKEWLAAHGLPTTAKRKADLMDRVQLADPDAPILDVLEAAHAQATAGKMVFKDESWIRIAGCARALDDEPRLREILKSPGEAEYQIFAKDPETGVPLKGKLDWVTQRVTLDLKTFSQMRGKSIDKTIADAIYYERYHIQAYFYAMLRAIQDGGVIDKAPEHVIAFVESDQPHETRIKALKAVTAGSRNLYWDTAAREVRSLIYLYAECMNKFGVDKPWRTEQSIEVLADEDIRQLAYA